jgi:tetratricopeptide (TPR) repeat protein
MVAVPTPIEIFCSYAHEDEAWLHKLEKHLSLLQRQGLISLWHDRLIAPGIDWARTIDAHLETASVILLLVSADFFTSDYCYGIEMKRALERQEAGAVQIIPILVRPADWKGAPFGHLHVLPIDAKPLSTWRNKDTALADIAAGIRRVIEDLPLLTGSAPRAALPAVMNIPFPRNSFFIGRDELLTRLHNEFRADQSTGLVQPQAISGLGGIGKTQIAIEYAYRFHRDYQAILWANAGSREILESSYLSIAMLLRLPEQEEREIVRIVQAVKSWLQTHSGWLLILDNVEDLTLLFNFLPPVGRGHVLITTQKAATLEIASALRIGILLPEQGALFLLRRAALLAPDAILEQASQEEQDLALQISQELGGLPLALDQAGAYLEETATSLTSYWQLYQQHRDKLLLRRGGVRYDHPEPVGTTWAIAFQRVEAMDPAAAELLRLCAYLAPDEIAVEIIAQGALHLGPLLEQTATDPVGLDKAIGALRAYSLVRRNPAGNTLSIHRLVQAVLRNDMSVEASREWARRVIYAVSEVFPSVDFWNWQLCQRCLPQAQISREYIEKWNIVFPDGVKLLSRAGYYLWDRAQYEEAEPFYKQLLTICEKDLSDNHPKMVSALNNLARIYHLQEKYLDATLLYQRALNLKEQLSDSEDPELLSLLENYADLLRKTGQDQDLATIEVRLRVARRSQDHWLQ